MRILQLIDTLNPGGAERMAINYANMIQKNDQSSFIICTRKEGGLKDFIDKKVEYKFLRKKHLLDIKSLFRLRAFISQHKIEVVHAHGSSWFYAVLCKILKNDFKLIWHDHYGNSEFLEDRPKQVLKFFSNYIDGIISVNRKLKDWNEKNIKTNNVIFINNFIVSKLVTVGNEKINSQDITHLVCLANLRKQKDHLSLLKACDKLVNKVNIKLHLIGREFADDYSKEIIREFGLRPYVNYYGEVKNPFEIIKSMGIGILSSRSEGLPLALLEYGLAGLPVVSTEVGDVKNVVADTALLVKPGDVEALKESLMLYIDNKERRKVDAENLKKRILKLYSDKRAFDKYMSFLKEIC